MSTTDEREILRMKPSWWAVILIPGRSITIVAVITTLAAIGANWLASHAREADPFKLAPATAMRIVLLGSAFILARLAWEIVARACRTYTLTERRFIAVGGVFHRGSVEVPLDTVQNQIVDKTLAQRLVGVGSVAVSTAASLTPDGVWHIIARPEEAAEKLRKAIAAARVSLPRSPSAPAEGVAESSRPREASVARAHTADPEGKGRRAGGAMLRGAEESGGAGSPPAQAERKAPLVLGLAGGIGSGKSEVARILASLGCVITDSDKEAKLLLDRPDIRDTLVTWWGMSILTPEGKMDRRRIADVVFADPAQRARLEGLIHPLLKRARAELIAGVPAGTLAVVIDAPLLFEAGLESECDAVLWVESPREARLARVRSSRGWSEAELERREKAQLPLEEKRRRSDEVILNDSDLPTLRARVLDAFERLSGIRRA